VIVGYVKEHLPLLLLLLLPLPLPLLLLLLHEPVSCICHIAKRTGLPAAALRLAAFCAAFPRRQAETAHLSLSHYGLYLLSVDHVAQGAMSWCICSPACDLGQR
jgi:hypothetical protein